MRYLKPEYYDAFRCTAGECPDSCCAGWQIMIDDESYDRYLKLEGEFGERMARSLDYEQQSFLQYEGRCAFLSRDNLCDLIVEKGEGYLCNTCARYPRHVEEFDGLREYSLSLSCPVAAQMILGQTEVLKLIQTEDEEPEPLEEDFEDFDSGLFSVLEEARDYIFEVLQNRSHSMQERLTVILLLASHMQQYVDEGRCFEVYDLLDAYRADTDKWQPLLEKAKRCLGANVIYQLLQNGSEERIHALVEGMKVLSSLERLRENWTRVLETEEDLLSQNKAVYTSLHKDFLMQFGMGGAGNNEMELFQENLAHFFLYTYFCGAVYDDCIYSKVALAVFSVCFLQEFVMCRWFLADKNIEKSDYVELSYRYAREVEHSDENLIRLEEWMMEGYIPVEVTE